MTTARTFRVIPDELRRLQVEASDPAVSAWVAANAGSGKTHVLAQRVIRLLLDGVDPAKILCITFTKAAAANMANRVFDELRRWTALDDAELDAAITRISGIQPDATRRTLARRLFAMALETPGGLKVQTIHAFCTRLLHHFPFEANVAARFDVLDEAAQAQLLSKISLGVLLDAALVPDGVLGRALATAIAAASDQTFKDVVGEAIRKRDAVRAWIDHGGSIDAAIASLCGTLGVIRSRRQPSAHMLRFSSTRASIGTGSCPRSRWQGFWPVRRSCCSEDAGSRRGRYRCQVGSSAQLPLWLPRGSRGSPCSGTQH